MQLEKILATARGAAQAAAAVHRRHLGRVEVSAWGEKGFADFVSHVDREAEARILERIRAAHPDHGILAEETAAAGPEAASAGDWLWVVDPLDGTTNYLHAYPMYAVSVAVLYGGDPVVGVVVNGASGEEWTATRGGGAFRDGTPIRVSAIDSLAQALIGTGFPFKVPEYIPEYLEQLGLLLRASAGVRRAGSAALDLCHLASGWFDGFWELSLAPWDVAAGSLIVREAGGTVTRLAGGHDVVGQGSILAGNPHIYRALQVLIGGREPRAR
ncbi:MAG TPA: inositol monophosphatase family protein [Longimicrobiales bacterium]|nr:inositol monophosphatase family protein [Longimicrobiales bacterium]